MSKMLELFQKTKQENDIEKVIISSSEDVTGNHINNCKNIVEGYDIIGSENCKYIATFGMAKDCYDCFSWGYTAEKVYECTAVGAGASSIMGCYAVWGNTARVYYSNSCFNCSDCFGCVGLKSKQYCIFNKQYSKETYEKLARKIAQNMIRDGEWGELSAEISPFAYNETMANLYFPLTRDESISR